MKRRSVIALGLAAAGIAGLGISVPSSAQMAGYTTLFDGKDYKTHFNAIGDANWKVAEGAVQADKGNGFLVSKETYKDFNIKAEFWVSNDANSGIFIRCSDPQKIGSTTGYEVNIFDQRPDPTYGTGAIVDVAKVVPMPKAGGKWNTYDITVQGSHFVVVLNGVKTVDVSDSKHGSGHVALQYGAGVVKFRKVEIKKL
jgi:hypothetical protein